MQKSAEIRIDVSLTLIPDTDNAVVGSFADMITRAPCDSVVLFDFTGNSRFCKAKKIYVSSRFAVAQQREIAMRNVRGARFLIISEGE